MAAEIINGQATLIGVQNNGSAITLTGYATFLLDKVDGDHNFHIIEGKDAIGFDASLAALNEYFEITIDFTPSGATRAAAAAIPVVPIPLAAVVLANLKTNGTFGSSALNLFNGTYVYVGGVKISQQSAQAAKLSGLKLRQYANSAQNTLLTTTVSG
jgi:hypothetical protein